MSPRLTRKAAVIAMVGATLRFLPERSPESTLLTLSALELAGIPVLGIVLTPPAVADRSTGTNAAAIARLSGIERMLAVPRTNDPDTAREAMGPVLKWVEIVAGTEEQP